MYIIRGEDVLENWKKTMSRAEKFYMPADLLKKIKVEEEETARPIFDIHCKALIMEIRKVSRTAPSPTKLDLHPETFRPEIPEEFASLTKEYPIEGTESLEICDECRGSKYVICSRCRGSGRIRCPSCGGDGRIRCRRCGGRGVIYVSTQEGVEEHVCEQCGGTGEVICSRCNGSGTIICTTCGGSGNVVCPSCNGTGKVWKYMSNVFTFTPCTHENLIIDPELQFMEELLDKLPEESWDRINLDHLRNLASQYATADAAIRDIDFFYGSLGKGEIVKRVENIRVTPGFLVEAEYDGKKFKLGAVGKKGHMIVRSFGMPLNPSKVTLCTISRIISALLIVFAILSIVARFVAIVAISDLFNALSLVLMLPWYGLPIILFVVGIILIIAIPSPPKTKTN